MSTSSSPRAQKRSRDAFDESSDIGRTSCSLSALLEAGAQSEGTPQHKAAGASESLPTPPVSLDNKRGASPARSATGSLTDAELHTPKSAGRMSSAGMGERREDMLVTFMSQTCMVVLDGTRQPAPKKQKLTSQEKEMKRLEKEVREREKADERARKEADKAAHAEEKARKEAERKKRDAEKEERRTAQEAERAVKEEKKRKRDEERVKIEEAKRKKDQSQMKLGAFFIKSDCNDRGLGTGVESGERGSPSPAPSNLNSNLLASPKALTPSKPGRTPYEKAFLEFFLHQEVTVAPFTRFERDEKAGEMLQKTIDDCLLAKSSLGQHVEFDPESLFHLPPHGGLPRGRQYMPVREIMEEMSGSPSRVIDLTTDSQNSQIKRTTGLLSRIPYKFIKFHEDVRPPYRGTYTSRPIGGIAKLARNFTRKTLTTTNYDYDSEAEWVEDEDGEDVKSEVDEEEDLDEDEDMEGFLDDENDDLARERRSILQGDLEPISSGLCWENKRKQNTSETMIPYRMEFILGNVSKSINPFSTAYWNSAPATAIMDPPRIPLSTLKSPNTAFVTNKSVKTFFNPISGSTIDSSEPQSTLSVPIQNTSTNPSKEKKLIPAEDLVRFKEEVQGSDLSKVGLIEVLKKKFPGRSGAAIKGTLESVATRVGSNQKDKKWHLLESHS